MNPEELLELLKIDGERIDRQEQAIRILAQCLEDGSWNGVPRDIDRILHPDKPEIAD